MKVKSSAVIKLRPTRGCQSPITADFRLLERGPESGPDSEGEMKICHKKESMSYTLPSVRMEACMTYFPSCDIFSFLLRYRAHFRGLVPVAENRQ